jgi:hypothetical protein
MEWSEPLKIREQNAWWKEFRKANADQVQSTTATNDKGQTRVDPEPGKAVATIKTEPRRDHVGNFLDAVRGKAPLACNIDLGCSTMVAIKMGVEAYRRNKVMMWDAKAERAVEA